MNKIIAFLKERPNLYHESHVVYLMVEIRKLLDKQDGGNKQKLYPVLRFYCDWTVHTEKSKITPEIKMIMHGIDQCIRHRSVEKEQKGYVIVDEEKDPLEKFIGMSQLRQEMKCFFIECGFPLRLINNDKNWKSFKKLFKEVLALQPIIKPLENIELFSFENPNAYILKFNDDRGEFSVIDIY